MITLSKRQIDWIFLIPCLILAILGIFTLFTTQQIEQIAFFSFDNDVFKQLLFLIFSCIVFIVLSNTPYILSKTAAFQVPLVLISIITLLGLFIFGGLVNSTRRWYDLDVFLLQPSEFVKYCSILWVSFWLTYTQISIYKRLLVSLITPVIMILLIFFQPDAGTSVMMLLTVLIILTIWGTQFVLIRKLLVFLFISGILFVLGYFLFWLFYLGIVIVFIYMARNNRIFFFAGSVLVVAISSVSALLYFLWTSGIVLDYQKERVLSFIGETDESFQVTQAKIAIGSGGVLGKGLGQGTQSKLRFLPESKSDFIFAAFVEERGFLGGFIIIVLYVIILLKMSLTAINTNDEYARLIIVGLVAKLWIELFVNIGMNLGIVPTKGVALPFLSYGGSSLISNFILVGVYLSIYRFNERNDKIMTDTKSFSNPQVEETLQVS